MDVKLLLLVESKNENLTDSICSRNGGEHLRLGWARISVEGGQ